MDLLVKSPLGSIILLAGVTILLVWVHTLACANLVQQKTTPSWLILLTVEHWKFPAWKTILVLHLISKNGKFQINEQWEVSSLKVQNLNSNKLNQIGICTSVLAFTKQSPQIKINSLWNPIPSSDCYLVQEHLPMFTAFVLWGVVIIKSPFICLKDINSFWPTNIQEGEMQIGVWSQCCEL